jgi:hypothetical protein
LLLHAGVVILDLVDLGAGRYSEHGLLDEIEDKLKDGDAFKPCHLADSIIGDARHLSVGEVFVAVTLLDVVDALDDIILSLASSWAVFLQHVLGSIVASGHLQTKKIQMI